MSEVTGKQPADSRVTLTQLMGPTDGNIRGNVHGGVIMKLCDEAGAMAAMKHARRPVVTVAIDQMAFHSPVHIGDVLTVTAEVTWVGRSSMEAQVIVTAENIITATISHTNTAHFVYVALDEHDRPMPVPPLACITDEDRKRYANAVARQALRLQLRQQEQQRRAAVDSAESPPDA